MADAPRRRGFLLPATMVVVGLASVVAVTQWRAVSEWMQARAVSPPASVTVLTQPTGAQVMVNGEQRGVTPLTLRLPAGTHALTIRNGNQERSMSLTAAAGADIVREIEFATPAPDLGVVTEGDMQAAEGNYGVVAEAPAPVANLAGWLSVQSPFDVEVMDEGETVGSSSWSRIMLPAGRHDVELINRALEFVERRRVQIAPGKTAAITVAAPQVAININARPWADVSVDGVALGQTPIANALMSVGSRQIVFRHPELGERRHDVVITTRPGQRISFDLTK